VAQEDRRLAAIVVADIVGYSRLMSENEGETLSARRRLRIDHIEPGISRAGGRLVSTSGDGFLAEFSSSVAAVTFAIELQIVLTSWNERVAEDRRIRLRIGINIGDVVVEGSDILGTGVNIAARLEQACEPGGVCIAHSVYELVRGILRDDFADGGELKLKNLEQPVRVWRWRETLTTRIARRGDAVRQEEIGRTTTATQPVLAVRQQLIDRHKGELLEASQNTPFIVFLCGPTLSNNSRPSAVLRAKLRDALAAEKIEVVLGEDDGLEDSRLAIGVNAQDNELEFIASSCNAVIVIADSVGSFCELGLFSWHFVHDDGLLHQTRQKTEFILLADEQFRDAKSYFNEGPAKAVNGFGVVHFVDFNTFDISPLLSRIRDRRGTMTVDNKRGRPRRPRS